MIHTAHGSTRSTGLAGGIYEAIQHIRATISLAGICSAHGSLNSGRVTQQAGVDTKAATSRIEDSSPRASLLPRLKKIILPGSVAVLEPPSSDDFGRWVIAEAKCYDSPNLSLATCNGFGSLEDCVAAVRVSKDLGIPFSRIEGLISSGYSLDAAIRKLHANPDDSSELRHSREAAPKDIQRLGT